MSFEEIEVLIAPGGEVTMRTIGIKGARCLEFAELLSEIVGPEMSRGLTAEFHELSIPMPHTIDVRQVRG